MSPLTGIEHEEHAIGTRGLGDQDKEQEEDDEDAKDLEHEPPIGRNARIVLEQLALGALDVAGGGPVQRLVSRGGRGGFEGRRTFGCRLCRRRCAGPSRAARPPCAQVARRWSRARRSSTRSSRSRSSATGCSCPEESRGEVGTVLMTGVSDARDRPESLSQVRTCSSIICICMPWAPPPPAPPRPPSASSRSSAR
jgi:hypothetical protein